VKKQFAFIIILFLFMIAAPLYSQVKQSHTIALSFLQLKDEHNLGIVFNGVKLEYQFGLTWNIDEHEISYKPKLGGGVGFNRGMTAFQIHITPVDVTWTMPFFEQNGHSLRGGFNLAADYSYQLYDGLHAARLFWASEIGLSPVITYDYQWQNKRIALVLQNSLLGFVSNKQENNPYFYPFDASEFLITPHETMKFGSFNNFNHTNIIVEFTPNVSKMHSFLYQFDYLNIHYGKKFERLTHGLFWRMSL
jgi:hypothetical protein